MEVNVLALVVQSILMQLVNGVADILRSDFCLC